MDPSASSASASASANKRTEKRKLGGTVATVTEPPKKMTAKARRAAADAAAAAKKAAIAAEKAAKKAAALAAFEANLKAFEAALNAGTPLIELVSFFNGDVYGEEVFALGNQSLFNAASDFTYEPTGLVKHLPSEDVFCTFTYWDAKGDNSDLGNMGLATAALAGMGRAHHAPNDCKELLRAVVGALGAVTSINVRQPKGWQDAPVMCTFNGLEELMLLPRGHCDHRTDMEYSMLVNIIITALAFGPRVFRDVDMIAELIKAMGVMEKPKKPEKPDDDDDDDGDDDEAEASSVPDVSLYSFKREVVADAVKTICAAINA